jgi:proteasome lid subunit RPN8/RPN11
MKDKLREYTNERKRKEKAKAAAAARSEKPTEKQPKVAEAKKKPTAPSSACGKSKKLGGKDEKAEDRLPGEGDEGQKLPEGKDITFTQFKPEPPQEPQWLSRLKSSDLVVPTFAISKFLVYAEKNTRENRESCAYLLGAQLMHKKRLRWIVTAIYIPEQEGTSVSCKCGRTHDPVHLLNKAEESKLQQVGTIHTHPRFSAFLSSIDMHSQFEMQKTFHAAVSLVVDKDNQVSAFRLTEIGMKTIEECKLDSDTFHEHPVSTDMQEDGVALEVPANHKDTTDLYIYIYTHIYCTRVTVCTHTQLYTCIHRCIYIYMYIYLYVYRHT